MNKYLEKIAEETNPYLQTAVGAGLLSMAPSRVLGYHPILHGTSKENAQRIRQEGLLTSKGGTLGGASDKFPGSFLEVSS